MAPGSSLLTTLMLAFQKCVLYWPEKRGIYGKVEVLVNSVQECENYTVRQLTIKVTICIGEAWFLMLYFFNVK